MSIYYDRKKINKILEFVLILLLVGSLAYAIGIIALGFSHKSQVVISYPKNAENTAEKTAEGNESEVPIAAAIKSLPVSIVVASKKGTKYHLPTCPGAKTILPENKITFPNAKAAEKAGYAPAKNCKGLTSPQQ